MVPNGETHHKCNSPLIATQQSSSVQCFASSSGVTTFIFPRNPWTSVAPLANLTQSIKLLPGFKATLLLPPWRWGDAAAGKLGTPNISVEFSWSSWRLLFFCASFSWERFSPSSLALTELALQPTVVKKYTIHQWVSISSWATQTYFKIL